jgi:hypothetical protein
MRTTSTATTAATAATATDTTDTISSNSNSSARKTVYGTPLRAVLLRLLLEDDSTAVEGFTDIDEAGDAPKDVGPVTNLAIRSCATIISRKDWWGSYPGAIGW